MVESANPKLLRKIASFAEKYEKLEFLPSMECVSYLLGKQRNFANIVAVGTAWLEDPLLALASAPWYGYAKQGAPPRFWHLAAQAIGEAANKVGQYSSTFPEEVWNNFVNLCRSPQLCVLEADKLLPPLHGPNKRAPVVRDLASLHLSVGNVMDYVCRNLLANAANCHDDISSKKSKNKVKGMGDKVTAFLLRDVAWVYGLEGKGSLATADEAAYIQPIDVRVRQVAECLWPELQGKDWLIVAQGIIGHCNRVHVSPIQFNQGAWYLGARVIKDATNLHQKLSQLDP